MPDSGSSDAGFQRPAAEARSALYGTLADLLSFPTADLGTSLRSGDLAARLSGDADALPYVLSLDETAFRFPDLTDAGLHTEYIRLFDVPGGGPFCPLYGGVYADDRRKVMEELLRFYRHFGLRVAPEMRDLPDSIPTVLEFLHFLTFRERASTEGEEVASLRAAQQDLLERHVTLWTPRMLERLAGLEPLPFYRAAIDLLHLFTQAELGLLQAAAPQG